MIFKIILLTIFLSLSGKEIFAGVSFDKISDNVKEVHDSAMLTQNDAFMDHQYLRFNQEISPLIAKLKEQSFTPESVEKNTNEIRDYILSFVKEKNKDDKRLSNLQERLAYSYLPVLEDIKNSRKTEKVNEFMKSIKTLTTYVQTKEGFSTVGANFYFGSIPVRK